jgi:hypothetical protein
MSFGSVVSSPKHLGFVNFVQTFEARRRERQRVRKGSRRVGGRSKRLYVWREKKHNFVRRHKRRREK